MCSSTAERTAGSSSSYPRRRWRGCASAGSTLRTYWRGCRTGRTRRWRLCSRCSYRGGCRTSTRWIDSKRDCILGFQPRRDRAQQARLLVVARQFPEHDAAQTLGQDVVGLAADRLGIVVTEHRATGRIVEPGHFGLRVTKSLVPRKVVRRDRVVVGTDRAGERLIEPIVVRGNAGEPASVEGDADDELVARHPLVEEGADGAGHAAVALPTKIARVAARFGEWGVEVRDAASLRAGHVVGHDVDPVEDLSGLAQFEAGDGDLTPGRNRGRQQVALARGRTKRVELAAQLLKQERAVSPILRSIGVLRQTATNRVLPVDVDPFENARPASQEELNARGGERLPLLLGRDGIRETARAGPAAHRDHGFQVGMALFEECELVKVAFQSGRVVAVAGVGLPNICLGILKHGQTVLVDQPEGVVDVGELVSADVPGGEVLRFGGPTGVIADDPPWWRRHYCLTHGSPPCRSARRRQNCAA